MPSVNASYWLLTALAAQLYMLMYLLMFITAIVLRFKYPETKRPFKIPGGNKGMWIITSMGIIGTLTTLAVSFIPPGNINIGSTLSYETTLIVGLILMCLPPFLTQSRWQKKSINEPVFD